MVLKVCKYALLFFKFYRTTVKNIVGEPYNPPQKVKADFTFQLYDECEEKINNA